MKPLVVANWKMNPESLEKARFLFESIGRKIKNIKKVEVVICPPFVYLTELGMRKKELGIKLGAQDCFWEEKGPFTGEISPKMLKDLGAEYVILGHSERRALGETDEMINKKIKAVIKAKLKPILCIGEKEGQDPKKILKKQLEKSLRDIPNPLFQIPHSFIIAYEPIWAIGTGKACQPAQAKKILLFLRKFFKKNLILYGGSVNSENCGGYLKETGFDGLLVGGASLIGQEFIKIVKTIDLISK